MDFQKTSPSSETVGFSKKCQKVDPHYFSILELGDIFGSPMSRNAKYAKVDID